MLSLVAWLLAGILLLGMLGVIVLHTISKNLFYLINLIEYGDKKNGRAPILPEAKEDKP